MVTGLQIVVSVSTVVGCMLYFFELVFHGMERG